jgi:phosphate transport system permease protein
MKGILGASLILALAPFPAILGLLLARGLPALSWSLLTRGPGPDFCLGGEGGIAHALAGSALMAGGGLLLAILAGLPCALALQKGMAPRAWQRGARFAVDLLWGIPSILVGACLFAIMAALGLHASMGAGMAALALVMLPILVRGADQAMAGVPEELMAGAYALGATRLEVYGRVVLRQAAPGLVTALLLALGRGLGDAASVLFTAGYTDQLPRSLGVCRCRFPQVSKRKCPPAPRAGPDPAPSW